MGEQGVKRKNSRRKGANFELAMARELTEWSQGSLTFRRSPLSGGWDPKAQTGDVFPLELKNDWPFIIEVRKNNLYTLDTILNDNSIVDMWFKEKSHLYDKYAFDNELDEKPIIFIMCRNHIKPVVVFDDPDKIFPWKKEDPYFIFRHIRVKRGECDILWVMDLQDFLSAWTFEDVVKSYPQIKNGF